MTLPCTLDCQIDGRVPNKLQGGQMTFRDIFHKILGADTEDKSQLMFSC